MIRIIVNGKDEITEDDISLNKFVISKNLKPEKIIIEHNFIIVHSKDWDNILLKENDKLEILRLVSGG